MGQQIADRDFTRWDFEQFELRLQEQLEELQAIISRPGFGKGERTLGAEVELYLLDQNQQPLCRNREVLDRLPDSGVALEINRYNLELNLQPVLARGKPFTALEQQILQRVQQVNAELEPAQQALAIGILPALRPHHFGQLYMTAEDRYVALSRMLRNMRGEQFHIEISGADSLILNTEDVTLEGANTSMQLHLTLAPDEFARWFNAAQLVTPIILGIATNSPLLFGRKLWHETRVPLFRQSIDGRSLTECQRAVPSRVDFGSGWVREGAFELFAELVNLHTPILPIVASETATDKGTPLLSELRLHSGTVWPWNRAVYDPVNGGHLRVEMRALPAGPTPVDMVANAAFMIGAVAYYQQVIHNWEVKMPFETLSSNFYAAAKEGIDAQIYWPADGLHRGLRATPLIDIAKQMLHQAAEGLSLLGVDQAEQQRYLSIIEQRIVRHQNGSSWMLSQLQQLEGRITDPVTRSSVLVEYYRELANMNRPVAYWPVV